MCSRTSASTAPSWATKRRRTTFSATCSKTSHKPDLNLRPSRVGKLDIIGNAYEFLIKNFAATGGKKAGEFYTPPEVSELIAATRGTARRRRNLRSRLRLRLSTHEMREGSPEREFNGSRKYALFGQEAIGSTWALAKMNMFLHGEDNHRIEWGDTIRNPKLLDSEDTLKHFDVVVANPPFSLEKWGHDSAAADKFGRFRRGLPPQTKGDYAFVLHMIETLKPKTGRMGVVVPHGVLFRGAAEGKIRKKLIEENLLDTVIGLPEKLFFGTGIPAAILIFRRNKADKSVLFIDASREYKDGKNQNQLSEDNVAKVIQTYKARKDVDKYAHLATLEEIKESDYNLNVPRYVDTFEEEQEIDLSSVLTERKTLKAELAKIEAEMDGYLKELGYGA